MGRSERKPKVDLDSLGSTTTVTVAGAILGISRGAAYQAARNGQLPTLRIGRRLVVPTAQLRQMLEGEVASPLKG